MSTYWIKCKILHIFQIQQESSITANEKKHSNISTLHSLNIKILPNYYQKLITQQSRKFSRLAGSKSPHWLQRCMKLLINVSSCFFLARKVFWQQNGFLYLQPLRHPLTFCVCSSPCCLRKSYSSRAYRRHINDIHGIDSQVRQCCGISCVI